MSGVTLAVADDTHQPPGIDAHLADLLFCMHDQTVRRWVAEQEAAGGRVVIADDDWVNPGSGQESLTFPVHDRDAALLAQIRKEAGR